MGRSQRRSAREEREADEDRLYEAISDAVDELARCGTGDVLVFLPGEREIREAAEVLRKHHPRHTEILPLYSRLSAEEQDRVFRGHSGRRVILATNVAETSLTVPGIRYVVDAGLARVKRYSYRSKVEQLQIEKISRAAARSARAVAAAWPMASVSGSMTSRISKRAANSRTPRFCAHRWLT